MTSREEIICTEKSADSRAAGAIERREGDSCAICLEPIHERASTAPCNHALFDYLCLLTWLLEHDAKCPLCKTEVTEVFHDFVSPTDFKTFNIPQRVSDAQADACSRANSRRVTRRNRRSSPPLPVDTALAFRRHVYRHRLYSLHVGANAVSGYRNFTPKEFAASAEMQARARKWIRRELRIFEFLQPDFEGERPVRNAEFLLEYVMALLRNVDIKDSTGKAESLLREFLGRENARLFLHELEAWLRSPFYDISDWDDAVQYGGNAWERAD